MNRWARWIGARPYSLTAIVGAAALLAAVAPMMFSTARPLPPEAPLIPVLQTGVPTAVAAPTTTIGGDDQYAAAELAARSSTLASEQADGTVTLWNVANPEAPVTQHSWAAGTGATGRQYLMAISPDGRTVALVSEGASTLLSSSGIRHGTRTRTWQRRPSHSARTGANWPSATATGR